VVGKVVRQVFDIPAPKVIVTEHQALRCRCSCGSETSASLPVEATSPACYGTLSRGLLKSGGDPSLSLPLLAGFGGPSRHSKERDHP
jgi:hypothetical protein